MAAVVAIFVFVKVMFDPNPVRTWPRVATVVLILSFIPDVLLAVIQYRRTLERGMRSHDDPRSGVGALCDAFTGTCYHEAPSENTGPGYRNQI